MECNDFFKVVHIVGLNTINSGRVRCNVAGNTDIN